MSQENAEVVRRMNAAFNRRDWDAWLSLLDPDVVYYDDASLALDTPAVLRGRDQVRLSIEAYVADLDDFRADIVKLVDAGDRVFSLTRWRGTGRNSGVVLELLQPVVWTLRNGLVIEGRVFPTPSAALEAVGLSE